MYLLGKFKYSGNSYFLYLRDTKQEQTFILISPFHAEDRKRIIQGLPVERQELKTSFGIQMYWDSGYALESIQKMKRSGKVKKFGISSILYNVTDTLAKARNYVFDHDNVMQNNKQIVDGNEREYFYAADSQLSFEYRKVNGLYTFLSLTSDTVSFELSSVSFNIKLPSSNYTEIKNKQASRLMLSSLKKIDYQILTQVLDMSWYRENGINKKEYRTIKSNEEFERYIMTPMIHKIVECQQKGIAFDVAVDTETTGLNVYDLSPDNPDKDHCVAIPICWEFGKSNVIFTDMAHFHNADNQYVIDRLALLFEDFQGEREITYWEYITEDIMGDAISASSATFNWENSNINGFDFDDFGNSVVVQEKKQEIKRVQHTVRIKRSDINLIGHNSIFDGRVFFDYKKKFYFNQDTLQMAFDINPQTVRGNKKLKVLTRFFFHAETPELVTILGKGNEDKYRYLEDEEVASIYGCADADFTLGCFYKLRALMSDRMYFWYQKQDIPMINILYQSEYWGLQTVEEEVQKLAEQTKRNIDILKHTMYEYVGVYVSYTNAMLSLKAKKLAGDFITEEEYQKAVAQVKPDYNAVYEFEFKPAQLRYILYDIMKYEIKGYTNGKFRLPKIDKYVIDKLLQDKLKDGEPQFKRLNKDILVYGADEDEYQRLLVENPKKAESMCLISAKYFNTLKYPLALIIKKHSELNKEYTSYYKPMETQNLEGKIFKSYNLARIETRRISNPGQTMKANLKALIRSYSDDYYTLDFDMSQIEQRIMVSMSGYDALIQRMNDPENDAHTETASMVEGKPPYKISVKERKNAKSVTFGVPYGLGLRKLCEKIFGVVNKETLLETRIILDKWIKNNQPIINLLESAREEALTEWKISDELRDFMGMWEKDENGNYRIDSSGKKIPIPISRVTNLLGFYRVFSLKDVGQTDADKERRAKGDFTAEESSIRRKSGNYPIQATASEIFRQILIRFYKSCERYGIADKIKWHMLIHDELLCSVHKSVHPFFIYKLVKEACMVTMKGHTKYYVGINIGDTWAQCKDDSREAPVNFVNRIIKRWDAGEFKEGYFDHPWDFIQPYMNQYFKERIGEVLKMYQPDADTEPIDLARLLKEFSNYTVRAYVNKYPVNGDVGAKPDAKDPNAVADYDNNMWIKRLESWAIEYYGEGKLFKNLDGEIYAVQRKIEEKKEKEVATFKDWSLFFEDDFEEETEEDSYWSYDEDSADIVYGMEPSEENDYDTMYEEEELVFDTQRNGTNVTDITVTKKKYLNLKMINNQLFITVNSWEDIAIVKSFLQSEVVDIGTRVVFKFGQNNEWWCKIRENYDVRELDCFLEFLKSDEIMLILGQKVFLRFKTKKVQLEITKALKRYKGNNYQLYALQGRSIKNIAEFSRNVSLNKLEQLVKKLTD